MRPTFDLLVPLALLACVCAGPAAGQSSSESAPYHIVLSRRAVGAGEQVEMKLVPPVPPGVRVSWRQAEGRTQLRYSAVYRAPYVIAPGAPPVRVSVGLSGQGIKTTVWAEIELQPGSVPGAEDCLGPGQSFSTTEADIVPHFTAADELPEAVHSVPPEYPRSARARGIEDVILVEALVCRSGRVLDAYAPPSYQDIQDPRPVQHDPKLVEAAIAAARQYVFKPAILSGEPIAVWVAIPIPFRLWENDR